MHHKFGYLVGGMGVAVAMLSFVATLEADVAHPGPRFDPGTINRSIKGDRLPLLPGASGANPIEQPRGTKSSQPRNCPVGHDMFSPEVAGRCLA
jgi:hypothetical protein